MKWLGKSDKSLLVFLVKNIKIMKEDGLRFRRTSVSVLSLQTMEPFVARAVVNQLLISWQGSQENERQSAESCVPNSFPDSMRVSNCFSRLLDFSPADCGDLGA